MEEWIKCEEFENYAVSNLGRLMNIKTNRVLKLQSNSKGALKYTFPNKSQRLIHRMIGLAFIPNPNNYPVIDHINRNATDNRVENLRWCTQSNNIRNYTKAKGKSSSFKGVGFHKSNQKFRAFLKFDSKMKTIGYFKTELEAAKAYNDFVIQHNLEDFAILNNLEERP